MWAPDTAIFLILGKTRCRYRGCGGGILFWMWQGIHGGDKEGIWQTPLMNEMATFRNAERTAASRVYSAVGKRLRFIQREV